MSQTAGATRDSKRLTTLLTNEELSRIERLRILGSRRFTNRSQGEHRSRGGGRSIEFKDYRDYVPGDDIRFLDWNILARLGKPFVKLYHDEEQLHVAILVDASSSMDFEDKLLRARQFGAAFGVMGLLAGERVSVHAFAGRGGGTRFIRVPRGRRGMAPLFRFLEGVEGGGDGPLEEGIDAMLKTHRGRGVVVLLSDFLTTGDLRSSFNLAHSRGLEIFGLQILGPSEVNPNLVDDLRLVDCETTQTLDITGARDLLSLYHQHRIEFQARLRALCQQRSGQFVSIESSMIVLQVLCNTLRRGGWVQ